MDEFVEPLEVILKRHGYLYLSIIGKGGFSMIYLVRSLKYGCEFAIKECLEETHPDRISQQNKEITTMMNLSHPYILCLYEYFWEHQKLYIVLEYCPGGNLSAYLRLKGKIYPPAIFKIWRQLLLALNTCHQNKIAHRDIKPDNVLIDQYGRPKLSDFGLSRNFETGEKSNTYSGSLAYMAPEIIQHRQYDPFAADIWSLGIMFYQMSTGEIPWPTQDRKTIENAICLGILQFPPDTPQQIISIIRSMVQSNPSKRPTCEELLDNPIFSSFNVPAMNSFSPPHSFPTSPSCTILQHINLPMPAYPTANTSSNPIKHIIPTCGFTDNQEQNIPKSFSQLHVSRKAISSTIVKPNPKCSFPLDKTIKTRSLMLRRYDTFAGE